MNNQVDGTDEGLRANKTMQTVRVVWMILIAVFAAVVLWKLYEYSNGRGNLRELLSPLGMIFVGAGAIVRQGNRNLSFVFTGIALVLVLSGLAAMMIY